MLSVNWIRSVFVFVLQDLVKVFKKISGIFPFVLNMAVWYEWLNWHLFYWLSKIRTGNVTHQSISNWCVTFMSWVWVWVYLQFESEYQCDENTGEMSEWVKMILTRVAFFSLGTFAINSSTGEGFAQVRRPLFFHQGCNRKLCRLFSIHISPSHRIDCIRSVCER